ncbi:hypothetical protein P167DRAFT_530999 [Morchella conica CCBAS932]|uniref:NB-ARC domain-containing protein n=1 Tax=Morchella conica CCBAS932 TaxID=1392247 RepID=A0A3N4K7J5_9PEZI|nr:hypothetical protein P167DRAFT_530999 [Morchella conica CCBAS932]
MHGGFKEVILSGLGGVGKTNIALEYAYRYKQCFTSVFWVNGSSEETILDGFRSIAGRLIDHYARNSIDATPNYNRIALDLSLNGLRWLSQQSNREWLLILDNVDDLESFNIDSFIPTCDHGTVIITTRRRRPEWLSNWFGISLTWGRIEKEAATELTKKLGNLPLALVQAGAYISANRITLRSYINTFDAHFKLVFSDLPHGSSYTQHDKTVFTTWQTSFDAIKRISRAASDLLIVCSFLSNEDIWEFMLQHGKQIDGIH